MRSMFLAPLALISLGAMAPPQAAPKKPDATRKCPPPVTTAATPKPGKPMVRHLNKEPPAALIATVYNEVDGCPVMLVLNGGRTGLAPGWVPAPESRVHPAE